MVDEIDKVRKIRFICKYCGYKSHWKDMSIGEAIQKILICPKKDCPGYELEFIHKN